MAFPSASVQPKKGSCISEVVAALRERSGSELPLQPATNGYVLTVGPVVPESLPQLCRFLFWDRKCMFGGITAEEHPDTWALSYAFLLPESGWIEVLVRLPIETKIAPSIVADVHAADWHEREIEDMFGVCFENHPRLGDFILHDQIWREGIEPMRKKFATGGPQLQRKLDLEWQPLLVVDDPGSFAMPIGPVYEGGLGEPLHFLLETVGEDVIRASPRLFYKYRAVEKIAEGRSALNAQLLAERFAATSAFAHSLAFCHAVERIGEVQVQPRAARLRVLIAELERLRHPRIEAEYIEVIRRSDSGVAAPIRIEKFAFYERSRNAYAILMTGEQRLYANIILKKGVIK